MNPDLVTTRKATPQDQEFLRRLFFTVRGPEFEAAGLTGDALESLLDMQYRAMRSHYEEHHPTTVYSILESERKPVGFEAVEDLEDLHLVDFAIIPECRNQGLGRARMEMLMQRAVAADKRVTLAVEVFNPARRLYERLGFTTYEDKGIYLFMEWLPKPSL